MKNKLNMKLTILFILGILLIIGFVTWLYVYPNNNIESLKECCENNYNGTLYFNTCEGDCLKSTLGWRCRWDNKDGGITSIPCRLMNCSG